MTYGDLVMVLRSAGYSKTARVVAGHYDLSQEITPEGCGYYLSGDLFLLLTLPLSEMPLHIGQSGIIGDIVRARLREAI